MPVSPFHLFLLFATALVAGAINSVAGGGTLLTFPALLAAGIPSVAANATSTVVLVPGSVSAYWGYRGEMGRSRRDLLTMALPSLLGGALGAWLAVKAGNALFDRLVPWLIFSATFLFLAQGPVRRWLDGRRLDGRREEGSPPVPIPGSQKEQPIPKTKGMAFPNPALQNWGGRASAPPLLGAGGLIFQFFVAVYGGFFGAGIGILMLAALGFLGQTNIHRMNGLKNFAAICINGVGAATFIFFGQVHWPLAALMAAGAVVGGFGGAGLARRVGQTNVRRFVVAIGLLFGAYTLWKQFV